MATYYCDNNTRKIYGMPLHNALVTLAKYIDGVADATYYLYDAHLGILTITDITGNIIKRYTFDNTIDFMDYCYKHDKSNAEYLNYISNNPKQQTFFI